MKAKASKELEAFIIEQAPSHYATADAPADWHALKVWYELWNIRLANGECYVIPVFDGGCEDTIYSSPRVNHAFRAWHDSLHLILDEDFSLHGEREVAARHVLAAERAGLSWRDKEMLWADTYGQRAYYQQTGEYVKDQAAFVGACMEMGLGTVLESGRRY